MARLKPNPDEPKPKRSTGRNFGSLFALFMVLGIVSSFVLYGIMLGKRNKANGPSGNTELAAETEPADLDPFSEMTYTEEALANKTYEGGSVGGFESDEAMWVRARDVYREAKLLIAEATEMRAVDGSDWRTKWSRAKILVEEAVDRGNVWRGVLVGQAGEGSSSVASLDKTLQGWRRTQMMLRKTGTR